MAVAITNTGTGVKIKLTDSSVFIFPYGQYPMRLSGDILAIEGPTDVVRFKTDDTGFPGTPEQVMNSIDALLNQSSGGAGSPTEVVTFLDASGSGLGLTDIVALSAGLVTKGFYIRNLDAANALYFRFDSEPLLGGIVQPGDEVILPYQEEHFTAGVIPGNALHIKMALGANYTIRYK